MTDKLRIGPDVREVKPQLPPNILPVVSTRSLAILQKLHVGPCDDFWVTDIGAERPATVDTSTILDPTRYAHAALVQGHVITTPVTIKDWIAGADEATRPLREGAMLTEDITLERLRFSEVEVIEVLDIGGHELLTVRVGELEVRVDRKQFNGHGKFITQFKRQWLVHPLWSRSSTDWYSYVARMGQ